MGVRIVALTISVVLLGGCSSVKKQYHEKFENKTVPSTARFADSTIAMLGNLKLQFTPDDAVLVKRFVDREAPEEQHAKALHDDMLHGISSIVWYSVELVDINESALTEAERVALYADYLSRFRERLVSKGRITAEKFDATLETVRGQEFFVEALRTAQPMLNTLISDGALLIGDLIDAVNALSLALSDRIDADYARIIHYRKTLEHEKFDILEAYEIIYEAYRSDSPNLSKLIESGVMWDADLVPEGEASMEDLEKIGEHLRRRLTALRAVQQEVEPDWEAYLEVHAELDHVARVIIDDARRARVLMLTWIKAHHSLAQGTIQEAEWFDIEELSKDLIKSAPDAILP